jgi:hypothetical protein
MYGDGGEQQQQDQSQSQAWPSVSCGRMNRRQVYAAAKGTLWGLSSVALARIGFRVATDERWEPVSDAYLRKLLSWCQSLTEPLETPDVLRLYASTPERGRQILITER